MRAYYALMKCTQCDSNDLVRGLNVVDRGEGNGRHNLELEKNMTPHAFFFAERVSAPVNATVCVGCGNVMLSINPKDAQSFKDAVEVVNLTGDIKTHPRYKEFLKSDPMSKYWNSADKARHFARWLRLNDLS